MADVTTPDMALRAEMIEMIGGCWTTQVCGTAVRLGLPDLMGGDAVALGDLAAKADCPEEPLRRLLRAMCSIGLTRQVDPDGFALTEKGAMLRRDAAESLHGLAMAWTARSWNAWSMLEQGVRTGETTVPSGAEGFASMAHNPEAAAVLNASQAARSRGVAREAARVFDFARFAEVMDLGGGYGTVLAAILKAHPHLKGAVVELPYLEDGTTAFLAAEGVAAQARFIPGSFFDEVPPGADCYILKSILHDWTDDQCAAILRNVAAAAKPGATLLVIEQVLPEIADADPANLSAFRTDLTMLLSTGGKERTEAEFAGLFAAAGFSLKRVIPNRSEFMLIEAVRDG